ncbi:hypothetical protein NV379_25150 [Paenibacillus sp. N1-5-1-14]|uniref:hypothetical protein n=1 Tax=Paenibacillus radicibacter TaxID=2972488 RepID=UPI002159700F|nr:hypothetical protein [Paenibacillus radicibacter]MCR8645926.1 hypothetical protein [Paenibacillus radicibacter]
MIGRHDPIAYHQPMLRFLNRHSLPYRIIEDAGHTMTNVKADTVNREILQFLAVP